MRNTVQTALGSLVLLVCAGVTASAADRCAAGAIDILKAASPNGYSVFRQVGDKKFFRAWLDCGDVQYGLPTAVHESVHAITGETDAYPLIGGGAVKRPPESAALFAPARIAGQFRPSLFVTTYLRPGGATAATDFRYLLDELNAYTHDLDTAIALDGLRDPDIQPAHRDGLAALMSFVALYVEAAETVPTAWSALKGPGMRPAVSALWGQAERTMVASCRVPDLGSEDGTFLRKACAPAPMSALERLLGRPPVCPKACLAPASRTASRE
ncbi:hypothetical protein [Methylobacterium radiodurans]|uniref:Uncharacterized protein n=1 Tax=Methylobacterium radiodurans TaxID=2202828 RepID=A0A2U8VYD2_9HYPH|nr:hypothetical protein [Methylobacterium radiodurans]AWN38468.1 hypothetical protein DK427_24320 [Methylobacterium radiodurans]